MGKVPCQKKICSVWRQVSQIILILLFATTTQAANITFTIAPSEGSKVFMITDYLTFMEPPGADFIIDKDRAISSIPRDETVFIVKGVNVGDWCFVVVGLYSDGSYTPESNIECIYVEDFFQELELKIQGNV